MVKVVEGDVAAHEREHGGLVGDEEGRGEGQGVVEGQGQGEADEAAAGAEFEAWGLLSGGLIPSGFVRADDGEGKGEGEGGGDGLERTNIVLPCRSCLWCWRRYLARTMPAGQSWPPQPSARSSWSWSGVGRRPPKSREVVVGGLWVGDWTRSSLMARGSESLSDMVGGVLAAQLWWGYLGLLHGGWYSNS